MSCPASFTDSSASIIAISPLAVMCAAGTLVKAEMDKSYNLRAIFGRRKKCDSHVNPELSPCSRFLLLSPVGRGLMDPVDEKNWLKESAWPTFVAEHRLEIANSDDALTKLLKERYNEGQHELRDRYVFWLQSEGSLPQVYDAARRVIEARLEAGEPGVDKVSVLKEKLAFAKLVEKQAERIARKSTAQAADNSCARYFRANTELELMRAEKEAKRDIEK